MVAPVGAMKLSFGSLKPLKKDKQFVLEWYHEFKWKKNPFFENVHSGKLFAGWKEERQRLNFFFIKRFRYGIIEGEEGTGKTVLCAWLKDELAKYKKTMVVIAANCKELKTEMEWIHRIMKEVLSFYDETIKRTQALVTAKNFETILHDKLNNKALLLIVDDIDEATPETVKLIERLHSSPLMVQLIVVGTEKGFKKTGLHNLKTSLKIRLQEMVYEDIKDMVQKRIEDAGGMGIYPFNDTILRGLCTTAKNNPRKILELAFNSAIKLSLKKVHDKEHGMAEHIPAKENLTKKKVIDVSKKALQGLKIGSIYTAKGIMWASRNAYTLSKQGLAYSKERYVSWKQNTHKEKSFTQYRPAPSASGAPSASAQGTPYVEDADVLGDVSLEDVEAEVKKEEKRKKPEKNVKDAVEKMDKVVKNVEKKLPEQEKQKEDEKPKSKKEQESLLEETDEIIKELERGL